MRLGIALLLAFAFAACEEPNDPSRVIPIDEYRESQGLPPLPEAEEAPPPPGPELWHPAETVLSGEETGEPGDDPEAPDDDLAEEPADEPEAPAEEEPARERRDERAREHFRRSIEEARDQPVAM
jgi:hypothetical protein